MIPNTPLAQVLFLNKSGAIWYSRSFLAEAKPALGREVCVIHKGIQPRDGFPCLCLHLNFLNRLPELLGGFCPAVHAGASLVSPKPGLCSLCTHASPSNRMNHSGTNEEEFGWWALALVSKPTAPQSWDSTYTATPSSTAWRRELLLIMQQCFAI